MSTTQIVNGSKKFAFLALAFFFLSAQALASDQKVLTSSIKQNGKFSVKITLKPETRPVDILLVVDDSGNMQQYETQIPTERIEIAESLSQSARDIQVGVITTSSEGSGLTMGGELRSGGGRRFFSNKNLPATEFKRNLEQALDVGYNGQANEAPFDSISMAISPALLQSTNKGFIRPQADLLVFFITDTDDQSNISPAKLKQELLDLKGVSGGSVSFGGAFVDLSNPACQGESTLPVRIQELIQLGGFGADFCQFNFANAIIDHVPTEGASTFPAEIDLGYKPVLSTLRVSYGSQMLQLGDSAKGFTIDSIRNKLQLGSQIDWSTEPGGTELVIGFEVAP